MGEPRARAPKFSRQWEASLAGGAGRPVTPDTMGQLAEEVKQRGRARLAAGRATPPR
jgi:hypothetical protein